MEFDRFLDVIRAFERAGVEYVLVGGVAVNLHGIVRATEDIDFFVRPDEGNVQRLKSALRSLWDDPEIDGIRLEDFETYPTLRYGPPGEELVIDVLTRLGTTFPFDDLEAESLDVEGVRVLVGTPRTLVRMKRNTLHPSTECLLNELSLNGGKARTIPETRKQPFIARTAICGKNPGYRLPAQQSARTIPANPVRSARSALIYLPTILPAVMGQSLQMKQPNSWPLNGCKTARN